jgi:hypothetical protein
MIGSFCELSIASVIVSDLGTIPWAGSHFGPVVGISFPQGPLHFHPCISFRQEQLWVRVWLWDGNPLLHLMPSLLPQDRICKGASSKVPHFGSWESLTSHVSGAFWRVPPTSYLPRLPVSILSGGPQGFRPIPTTTTRSGSPLPCPTTHPILPPRPLPPAPLVIAFFSLLIATKAS